MDHSKVGRDVRWLARIHVHVSLWRVKWRVRSVRRNVSEERFLCCGAFADETFRLAEKHIGAESFRGDDPAIVDVAAVEVGVVPNIGCLPHPAATVTIDLGEASIFGTVWKIVSQMPFAEQPGGITRVPQHGGDGGFVFPQHRAAVHRVPDAGAIGPMTC